MAVLHQMPDHLSMNVRALKWKRLMFTLISLCSLACAGYQVYLCIGDLGGAWDLLINGIGAALLLLGKLLESLFVTVFGFLLIVAYAVMGKEEFDLMPIVAYWAEDPFAQPVETISRKLDALELLGMFWPLLIVLALRIILRCAKDARKELSDTIEIFSSGVQGESKMRKLLMKLPDQYDVFQNLYITDDTGTSETDFVVIGPNGAFIVETKNYKGAVQGNVSHDKLLHVKRNRTEEFHNPVKQVGKHVYRMKNRLRKEDHGIWIQGIVGFVGDAVITVENTTDIPIFSGAEGEELLRYIVNYDAYSLTPPGERARIVEILEQESEEYRKAHPDDSQRIQNGKK